MAEDDGIVIDELFRNSKGKVVEPPVIEGPIADTHCHLDMLQRADLALARCAYRGVSLVVTVTEATMSPELTYDSIAEWLGAAAGFLDQWGSHQLLPMCRIVAGCHPHEASHYDEGVEARLRGCLAHPLTVALGEIGLDYHYDLSPRDVQRDVFRRQLELADECGMPVVLHIREAHDDALQILREHGMPVAGALVHCFTADWATLEPFIEMGCYVAFGGALTFNNGDAIRDAARRAPLDRIVTETDAPYMAPAPLRGVVCSPEFTVFTANRLAEVRGIEPDQREEFFATLYRNAHAFYRLPL